MIEKKEVPRKALQLVDSGGFAHAFGKGEDDTPNLAMVAYSGGMIADHWWWGNLVIDLAGMSFKGHKFPVLEDHLSSKKIGFSSKPHVSDKLEILPESFTYVDTEEAAEFIKLSKSGFPYQASIYAEPTAIENVVKDTEVEVNGRKFKGPLTVWRKSNYKEASVTVFGYDSNTKSSAFSENVELDVDILSAAPVKRGEIIGTHEKEVRRMTLDELKKDNPDAFAKLKEEVEASVKKELTDSFSQEKDALVDKFSSQVKELSEQLTAIADRNKDLEKAEAIRAEKDLQGEVAGIWAEKLSKSDIPPHLYPKVQSQISHSKFMTEAGVLDKEKFVEAIDAEIKDWEDKGVVTQVLGSGSLSRSGDDPTEKVSQLAAENKKLANSLLSLVGQQVDA